jgi:Na+-translocating ferredoxin:NAD+ oxidoreductase RnfD subunit
LRRFAIAITVLNILGHTVLGFEQAWIVPFVAVLTAYAMELLLETVDAWAQRRPPRYVGGIGRLIDCLLSAHISGLAVGMLLYSNARLRPVVCAAVIAIASKALLRARIDGNTRHVFNPSNFGITTVLLAFPSVGIAPPYQFTENLDRIGDWLLPALIVCSGTFLNVRFTKRVPLILSWVSGFVAQAAVQGALSTGAFTEAFLSALVPMTGVAFVLYTFYMATDPATTPSSVRGQIAFGGGLAAVYGLLSANQIVFGLFFSLTLVSAIRGFALVLGDIPVRLQTKSPVSLVAERGRT